MTGTSKVLTYIGGIILALVAIAGGLFAAGYAFSDFPLWIAISAAVAWIAFAGLLAWLAFRSPEVAVPVLLAFTLVVSAVTIIDSRMDLFQRDTSGPVAAVVVLAMFIPLATLGLKHPTMAGLLLALLGISQLLATAMGRWSASGEGPGFLGLFMGSSGALVAPMLIGAVLFLIAGGLAHDHVTIGHISTRRGHPAH
ncbi:hypothetical protein LKO27_01350 [Tessaracoccus sp. OS52]|uniref:hypothetical protein n=1 Tax=Tessaracoccus sp. OS52 TaxID=2886691 RepID=UPI001D100615|nr:hypothetical protein [Tessaracoccus sp. OS52]MCC2592075.1 hypothetical protein [Tessaracoccus sp. OS52]